MNLQSACGLLAFFSRLGNGVANRADIAADAGDRVAGGSHQRRCEHDGDEKFAHEVFPFEVVPAVKMDACSSFRKFGARVVYAATDLRAWADGRAYGMTSDPGYVQRDSVR